MDNDNVKMGGGNGIAEGKMPEGASLTMQSVPPVRSEMPTMDSIASAREVASPGNMTKLSEEEKMKAENFALHFENLSFRKSSIQQIIVELNAREQQLKLDLHAFKVSLGKKYGMNPLKLKIKSDGTILESTTELGQ
jgi:hypothetical protein